MYLCSQNIKKSVFAPKEIAKLSIYPEATHNSNLQIVGCRFALDKGVWRYLFEWRGRWLTF